MLSYSREQLNFKLVYIWNRISVPVARCDIPVVPLLLFNIPFVQVRASKVTKLQEITAQVLKLEKIFNEFNGVNDDVLQHQLVKKHNNFIILTITDFDLFIM